MRIPSAKSPRSIPCPALRLRRARVRFEIPNLDVAEVHPRIVSAHGGAADGQRLRVDEAAQATGYRALLEPMLDEPDFAGFFVWRVYADPDDTSQEPPWAFSPRGKQAEIVLRDAFASRWACDAWSAPRWAETARVPGLY